MFNHLIVNQRDSLLEYLEESTLEHEVADGGEAGITPCDVRLCNPQHVHGGLVDLEEHAIVYLAKSKKLEDLPGLWSYSIYSSYSDCKGQLRLIRYVKTFVFPRSLEIFLLPQLSLVLILDHGSKFLYSGLVILF